MYQFFDRNSETISLHDCRATHVFLNKDVVSFDFPDGFWISEKNPRNPYGKLLGTDQAQVDFHLLSGDVSADFVCYVFDKKQGKVIRKTFGFDKLARKLDRKGQQLEFLYAYTGYKSVIFECRLWRRKKPASRECVLILATDDVKYRWNRICPDRVYG